MIYLLIPASIAVIYGICYIIYRIMEPRYADTYTWHINKGHHFCSLWQRIVFCMFWIGGWKFTALHITYTAYFNESMKYDHKNGNQTDWNKLPGFQKGFDKRNRVLRGWRYYKKEIQTCEYAHVNSSEHVDTRITRAESITDNLLPGFDVFLWKSHIYGIRNPYSFATPLFVYFGGDEVAPNDMDITITGMVVK